MDLKIHSYESMGTYDGPGLRLVVFLQGCPFRCLYCANPDTIPFEGGKVTKAEEVLAKAVSQKPFFGKKGGITFSGGEPTVQAEALVELCRMLKEAGIHICIDTNGGIWNEHVKELFQLADLIMLDIKQMDPSKHKALTSRDNARTLGTALWLEKSGKAMWLRYVLVPGISDAEEDIRCLGEHFKDYKMIERVEILPYHTLGVNKYEALEQDYKLKDVPLNSPEQLKRAEEIFREYFGEKTVLN